jgi:2-polyprenyl-3-methyl-5-hydroxy-6-metoxy-1,4-benzoquinol methylase
MTDVATAHPREAPTAATACVFCGDTAAVWYTRHADPWGVIRCSRCGLGRTVPQPTAATTLALVEGDYADSTARKFGGLLEGGRRYFVRRLARRIERHAGRGGRVLDIGCGDGKLLVALAGRGYACTGTDLNPRVGETVPPGSGVELHPGDVESAHFPTGAFRVVILRQVLEHLRNPPATLREVRRVIQDDGRLFVALPNLDSWQGRLLRDHWFHLDLPRHLFHFSPRTLETVLADSGFEIETLSHFSLEQNPYGWLQSTFTAAGGRWRALYDQLRAPGSTHAQPRDPLVSGAAAALTPLCVALATIESACRRGGTIEVWARPK